MEQSRTIFKGALLVTVIAVSGCLNTAAGGGGGGHLQHAAPQVRVMSKSFTIAGPRGFCIDPGATRDEADSAFAVLGSCAVISGNPKDSKPKLPAMLTASVAPAPVALDAAALDKMAAFFSTPDGRGALARADDVQNVLVIDMVREEGLLLVHAEDGDRAGDVTADYWRGIFETGGKLVTVTVSGFRAAPLDNKTGARLTRAFVASLQKANPAPSGESAQTVAGTGSDLVSTTADRLASFFNRLP